MRSSRLLYVISVVSLSIVVMMIALLRVGFNSSLVGCTVMVLEEPVLIVSDLHYNLDDRSRFKSIGYFIVERNIRTLVIAGDLFESPRVFVELSRAHGGFEEAMLKVLEDLGLSESTKLTLVYIEGSPPHDPRFSELRTSYTELQDGEVEVGNVKVALLEGCFKLRSGDIEIIVTHGDTLYDGIIAFAVNLVMGGPASEIIARRRAGIPEDVWLVAGHNHHPNIDVESRVANPGAWCEPKLPVRWGYGVLVEDGKVTLVKVRS